jgi:hypothetical protein
VYRILLAVDFLVGLGYKTAFAFKKGNFRRPQHENEIYMQEKEMGAG